MKAFNYTLRNCSGRLLAALALFVSLSLVSCEDSVVDQIATERTLVHTLQIQTTPELPLLVGRDSLLTLVSTPDAPTNPVLLWSSDNEEVASVSQAGKVSAHQVGSAVITVKSTDGSARSAAITVKVIDKIEYITDITLTASSQELFEGETLTLDYGILPANATYKTIKWSSSDPAIATVSESGEVTGKAKGNVTITAASTDGSGKSKSIALVVKEVIPLTDLAIATQITETLALGQTLPVEVTLTPANATAQSLQWSSNNDAVATVSSTGVITAVADGQATITVSAKNNPDIRATLTVVVEAGKVNDTFFTATTPWRAVTSNSTGVIVDGKFRVTMAAGTKYRGDIRRDGGVTLHAGKYPIIAFKFNRPNYPGNVIFDTNNGSYLNGNNKLTTITGKDGVQVHYADLSTGTFGSNAIKLSTTQATTLTTFQLKVADFVMTTAQADAGGKVYEVYWVKSFKSLSELEAYINK